jgi:hypothetical protein
MKNWQLAVALVLAGSLALACAGEQRTGDDAQLVADQRLQADGQRPAGQQPPAGEQPPSGEQQGSAPWMPPRPGCEPQTTSIHYTGILTDMTTGEASCSRQILVCGDLIRTDKTYNTKRGEKCPFVDGERTSIAYRVDGVTVCCDDWEKAKQSKSPCDPLADADCDGIPNDDDVDTLLAAAPSPG